MSTHLKLHSFTGTTDHDFTGLVSGELIQYDGSGISSAGVLPASGTSANLWSASTGSNSIIANNGTGNVASGNFAIAGGAFNTAGGDFSVNFGAVSSTPGEASFAAATNESSAVGFFSSVIGGENNTATGYSSSVIASTLSTANGSRSVVIASDGLTNSFNNTLMTMNARLAEGSGSVIYSAGTDLYDIFLTSGDVSGTSVSAGSNVEVQLAGNDYEVSVVDSPSFNNFNASGTSNFTGAIQSGGTDLYSIFSTSAGVTGSGTVNTLAMWDGATTITDSPLTYDGVGVITVLGDVNITGNVEVLGTATTINTQDLFVVDNTITLNSGGTATSATGGGLYIESGIANGIDATWLIDANGNWETPSGIASSALTVSGGVLNVNGGGIIQSGGTDLYDIFLTEAPASDITRVQPGTNITTGGTENEPIINLTDSPSVNNFNASGTSNFTGVIQSGGTDLYSIFSTSAGVTGSGTVNTIPIWDGATTIADSPITYDGVGVVTVGSDFIVTGDFEVQGTTTTINTTTLQAEDNNIELNFGGNNTSANGGGITILSGVSNSEDATWEIDGTGNWSANAGIQGTTVTATEFFSMAPYTGSDPATPSNNDAWFHSGATGTITLNYRVGGVNYSVELS